MLGRHCPNGSLDAVTDPAVVQEMETQVHALLISLAGVKVKAHQATVARQAMEAAEAAAAAQVVAGQAAVDPRDRSRSPAREAVADAQL